MALFEHEHPAILIPLPPGPVIVETSRGAFFAIKARERPGGFIELELMTADEMEQIYPRKIAFLYAGPLRFSPAGPTTVQLRASVVMGITNIGHLFSSPASSAPLQTSCSNDG